MEVLLSWTLTVGAMLAAAIQGGLAVVVALGLWQWAETKVPDGLRTLGKLQIDLLFVYAIGLVLGALGGAGSALALRVGWMELAAAEAAALFLLAVPMMGAIAAWLLIACPYPALFGFKGRR